MLSNVVNAGSFTNCSRAISFKRRGATGRGYHVPNGTARIVKRHSDVEPNDKVEAGICRQTDRRVSSNLKCDARRVRIAIVHFLLRLPEAVILLVDISSPIYRCRNRLWLSSLSCSSRTASIRLNMVMRDSWSAWACLHPSQR